MRLFVLCLVFICALELNSVAQIAQYNIRIHAIRVSNDDGSFPPDISTGDLGKWVDYANSVYAAAGVKFISDVEDFSDLRSTAINLIDSDEVSYKWAVQKMLLDNEAANYPDRLVIFFVYGDTADVPRGGGFSWLHYNFVVMPGFHSATICGHQNITMLAHELGHYLGLVHTFEETFTSRDTLLKRIAQYGIEYMDGDALSSTPLDPALYEAMECYDATGLNDTIYLNGVLYHVPRSNIMSYYDYPYMTITDEQIEIIHRTLREHPLKKHLVTGTSRE